MKNIKQIQLHHLLLRQLGHPFNVIMRKGNKKIRSGQMSKNHTFLIKMRSNKAKKLMLRNKTYFFEAINFKFKQTISFQLKKNRLICSCSENQLCFSLLRPNHKTPKKYRKNFKFHKQIKTTALNPLKLSDNENH